EVLLNIGDTNVVQAIEERNPSFFAVLEKLAGDYEEIDSVMLAADSLSMWLQSSYANNRQAELHRILHSVYASDKLKQKVRQELGYVTAPTGNLSPTEWKAMMYGTYQAMPEDEKQALHEWEREYVDGSGRFATSDWPGWVKYIGKAPSTTELPEKKKKRGFVYLVRANTGEYKIGYSIDIQNRLKAFAVQPPFEYKLIHSIPVDDMLQAESVLHDKFSHKRIRGEWFTLSEEDVIEISQLISFQDDRFSPGPK
ncbi:MAG: GIY-YIG nuclease family protein, partial [Nitrospirales bacterium]